MTAKDADLRKLRGIRRANIPVRTGAGTVSVEGQAPRVNLETTISNVKKDKHNSAASHTYDIGYKKWENFREDEDQVDRDHKHNDGNILFSMVS